MTSSAEETELDQLHHDVLWTEKGHFTMAGAWKVSHFSLGILSTVASGFAATTLITTDNPALAASAALVSSIAAGLMTFLKPQDHAVGHLDAAKSLGSLRVKIRQVRKLDVPAQQGQPELRLAIQELAEEKAQADSKAPHISNWAMSVVAKRVARGDFAPYDQSGSSPTP